MSLHTCPSCRCVPIEDDEPEVPLGVLSVGLWILTMCVDPVYYLCMWCGSEPLNADGDHTENCPTLNTCASMRPNAGFETWHPDAEWLVDGRFTSEALRAHLAAEHPGVR